MTRLTLSQAKKVQREYERAQLEQVRFEVEGFAAAEGTIEVAAGATGTDSAPDGATKVRDRKRKISPKLDRMLEDDEQMTFIKWVELYRPLVPALKWLYHVPNGEKRERVQRFDRKTGKEYWFSPTGNKLKLMGTLAGISDIVIDHPMPRDPGDPGPDGSGWYHGARLELKRRDGDPPTGDQAEYLRDMEAAGYFVGCHYGSHELWVAVQDYLWIDMPYAFIPDPRPRPGPMCRRRELVLKRPRKSATKSA